MKENVLDVLMYLFEHCTDDGGSKDDRASIEMSLSNAGFHRTEIEKALNWLDSLAELQKSPTVLLSSNRPIRIFSDEEKQRLTIDCLGLLMFLEESGVLDPYQRELVLDRAMALDDIEIDMDDLKWVILMVLFNQPGQEEAFAWMENLVFDSYSGLQH